MLAYMSRYDHAPTVLQIIWMADKVNGYVKLTVLKAALLSRVMPMLLRNHQLSQNRTYKHAQLRPKQKTYWDGTYLLPGVV